MIAPAFAQSPGQRIILEQTGAAPRQEGSVRVQSAINLFIPGPTGEGEEAQKLRDRARRIVYDMAAHECDLLREVMAKDCRLEAVNSNLNRQSYGSQQPDGYTVNGTMNLQITLK
jgi:predicted dehydrogenase